MIVATFNLNGSRSACSKGFLGWVARHPEIDVLMLQELKGGEKECSPMREALLGLGFAHVQLHCAQRPGYAGSALCSRELPDLASFGIGSPEFDAEGRLCRARFGVLELASAYFPSGSAGPHRQASKMRFLDAFAPWADSLVQGCAHALVGADLNIARTDLDLKNWKGNLEAPGCTSAERAWLESWIASGWSDPARALHPRPFYTWWSPRAGSRQRDVGWRIDAHIATAQLGSAALSMRVDKEPPMSDHAPLTVEYAGSFQDWAAGRAP